jgi:hypothetical protein
MWYEDLSPYSGDRLLAVGWLERGRDYPRGAVAPEVYAKLVELCRDPWQPVVAAGVHACSLCLYASERSDGANLFLPDGDRAFVAPVLIRHYMNAHHYRPPDDFCRAVLACPEMRSKAFREALVRSGLTSLLKSGK